MSLDPDAERNRTAVRSSSEPLDEALTRAFALLELHRHVAFLLAYSRRPVERHEGRLLVAAIDRLERYLRVAEELTEWDAMRFWVEDILAEEVAEHESRRSHRLLPSGKGTKARAQARARFEEIAAQVLEELEAGLSQAPASVPDEGPSRCAARTRQGTRCKNPAIEDGMCKLHSGLATALARELRVDPGSNLERDPTPADGAIAR